MPKLVETWPPARSRPVVLLQAEPFKFGRHTLIFTHLPKCGGTSLHNTLSDIFADRYRLISGAPEDREGLDALMGAGGHQRFGSNLLARHRDDLVYITLMRRPVDRFVSFYRHIQDHPQHHLRLRYPNLADASPLEFAQHLAAERNPEIGNLQAYMLAPGARNPYQAISHIEAHYSMVGLVERLALYMEDMQTLFPNFELRTYERNKSVARAPDLEDEAIEFVEKINSLDIAVYKHFERKLNMRRPADK